MRAKLKALADRDVLANCQVLLTFSVSRPDVPLVPGRIRMEIEAEDFLVLPSGFLKISKMDPKGWWKDPVRKALWYTTNSVGTKLQVHNIRDLVAYSH